MTCTPQATPRHRPGAGGRLRKLFLPPLLLLPHALGVQLLAPANASVGVLPHLRILPPRACASSCCEGDAPARTGRLRVGRASSRSPQAAVTPLQPRLREDAWPRPQWRLLLSPTGLRRSRDRRSDKLVATSQRRHSEDRSPNSHVTDPDCPATSGRGAGGVPGGGRFSPCRASYTSWTSSSLPWWQSSDSMERRTRCAPCQTSGASPLPGPQQSTAARVATTSAVVRDSGVTQPLPRKAARLRPSPGLCTKKGNFECRRLVVVVVVVTVQKVCI